MPLKPHVQKFVDEFYASKPPMIWEVNINDFRKMIDDNAEKMSGEPEHVKESRNFSISGPNGDIPLRLYIPDNLASDGVVLYIPGSGFTNGGLESQDGTCRQIANRAGCRVIQISYRAAPEYKFPIGLYDAFSAIEWVSKNADSLKIDAKKIAISGTSSGGNFAALTAIWARDNKIPVCCMILNVPVTDLSMNYPSAAKYNHGYILEQKAIDYFFDVYIPLGVDKKDPKISPYYEKDLTNLPPALIQTVEFDPLADDGKLFADKLQAAGNEVKHIFYKGEIHSLIAWAEGVLKGSKNPCDDIGEFVKEQFCGSSKNR